ncbi:MAG TPA: TolC family protein [Clostridia bacterium]|nr:TolC family protein [Clostridia bacterium]
MTSWRSCLKLRCTALLLTAGLAVPAAAEQLTFRRTIELALEKNGVVVTSAADIRKAQASYLEARNAYLPIVVLGSGLGYSKGVPLTLQGNAPTIFNLTSQQFLLNFAQRDFLRAARSDISAAQFDAADRRNTVLIDAALAYIELDNVLSRLRSLKEQQQAASRVTFIAEERLREGIDSPVDAKRAQLAAARVELRIAQATTAADVLRDRIARWTGVSADSIETVPESIPDHPDIAPNGDYTDLAVANNPVVKLADERARAAEFRARAETKQNWPSIDLASQYAVLSRYNNYEDFYQKFERNNITVGLSIRFPVFNFVQKARNEQAKSDSVKARVEADGVRAQVRESTLKLHRSLRQLAAAAEVARLEHEIAEADASTTESRVQSGATNSRQAEQARLDAGDRYIAYLEASLELWRAQVELLRSTGELEDWAMSK